MTNKDVTGIPIYGANDREHIHYSEVMLGEAPIAVGDQVIDVPMIVSAGDYLLVATGCGSTVSGARKSAYAAIKKIHAPGSPFYRLDIGRGRLLDQIPQIQKHGYAQNLAF
jgi:phosphoribosylamine--glycine ligase